MVNIANRLKEIRIKSGLSQEDVAKLMGINVRTYQNYEYGRTRMDCGNLLQLCEKLNLSMDYLFDRTGDPQAHLRKEKEPSARERVAELEGILRDLGIFADKMEKQAAELKEKIDKLTKGERKKPSGNTE